MTRKLYDENAYIKEFEATVIDSYKGADGYFTILDRTAFFPEGGGQPSDIGFLNDIKVYDVQINEGIIYHYTEKQFQKGEKVTGVIDFDRRFDFMQHHSGEHIVSGVAHNLLGCENVGFHLSETITTLDLDKMLSPTEVLTLQREANRKIYKNARINAYYPDSETLKTLEYRSKKELHGDIRIVEIEDTDICACCAPHVKNAGEIGFISLKILEKVRGGVRLELKCGMRALKDIEEKDRNISEISSALCVKPTDCSIGVERLIKQIAELKFKNNELKRQITENKVLSFNPSKNVTAEFEENMDIKELQHYADALFKKAGGIRGVFSLTDNGYFFAFCGEAQKTDEFFKGFREKFEVRGGGRNGMVQGTVFASREDLLKYINIFQ